jgi:hypothetical protein
MEFEDTMTETDFRRPLLEGGEESYVTANEPDLAVDGLKTSLMSRLFGLFQGKST